MRRRLTFANVTSLLALFFALTAGSYAAVKLPANSVTTKQVKNHSLMKADFKNGQVPRGTRGPEGAAGAPGPAGAVGPQGPPGPVATSTLTRVDGPDVPVGAFGSGNEVQASMAVCPAGQKAISGGVDTFTGGLGAITSQASTDRSTWFVVVANESSYGGGDVKAIAYCAGSGQAVTASKSAGRISASARAEVRRAKRQLRARLR